MITIEQLAKEINNGLNNLVGSLNSEREKYLFRIVPDTTNYKKGTRVKNSVTRYIYGILSQVNSATDNTSNEEVFATINTRLGIIVPILNSDEDTGVIADGEIEIIQSVRQLLDGYFSKNKLGEMTVGEENYSYSINYSFSQTGVRQQLSPWGDCFTFTVYINYYLAENGINSRAFKVTFDGEDLPIQTLNISRNSVQQSVLVSDTANGATKNTTESTQLVFSVTTPVINNNLTQAVLAYILKGENTPHTLTVAVEKLNILPITYSVIFNDSAIALQGVLNGGFTFTLAEAIEFDNSEDE